MNKDQRKAFARYMAARRRRQRYIPAPELLPCADGPWAGHHLALTVFGDGRTATLRIGAQRGFYERTGGHLLWYPL